MSLTRYAVALLALLPGPVSAQTAPPAHIILFRHAEKPVNADNPHLSNAGRAHAQRLVAYFTSDPAMTKYGAPAAIFATHPTKDADGQRTSETVTPLARALKLPVQTPFLGKEYAKLAKRILANPAYSGKTVLICWNHEVIPQLARALGVSPRPAKWKGSDFGTVYVISYSAGKVDLTRISQ